MLEKVELDIINSQNINKYANNKKNLNNLKLSVFKLVKNRKKIIKKKYNNLNEIDLEQFYKSTEKERNNYYNTLENKMDKIFSNYLFHI